MLWKLQTFLHTCLLVCKSSTGFILQQLLTNLEKALVPCLCTDNLIPIWVWDIPLFCIEIVGKTECRKCPSKSNLRCIMRQFQSCHPHTKNRLLPCQMQQPAIINHLKCSGVRWLHLKLFNAIQV